MTIKNTNLSFKPTLKLRNKTNYIVLHHRAGTGDAESIHTAHINQGWSGAGYHIYIRKSGESFYLRPLDYVGAHTTGFNDKSVGVCFEGDFEKDSMTDAQKMAGVEVISFLKKKYPDAAIVCHKDLSATLCPGKNFPEQEMKELKIRKKGHSKLESANDITWELGQMIEITDVGGFVRALDEAKKENSPLYWGFFKLVNKGG